jgi:hypothetical protein
MKWNVGSSSRKAIQTEWNLMGTLVAHHGNERTKDGNILLILKRWYDYSPKTFVFIVFLF